jgi:dipeptidyl aminopeptidase/acylaminoacyl peptidase
MISRIALLSLFLVAGPGYAQNDGALPTRVNGGGTVPVAVGTKRAVTPADYAVWKSVVAPQLSRNGAWAAYAINPAEGDGTLVLRHLHGGAEWKIERGGGVRFSRDARWALVSIAAPFAEIEAARKAKKEAPRGSTVLVDLFSGKVEMLDKVRRAAFPDEGAGWLALHAEPPATPTAPAAPPPPVQDDPAPQGRRQRPGAASVQGATAPTSARVGGTELTLRPLAGGQPVVLPDITNFQFDRTGTILIYTVDAKDDAKDGVYARTLATGETATLASGPGTYSGVALDDAGAQAALLFTPKPKPDSKPDEPKPTPELRLWRVGQRSAEVVPGAKPSENAPPRFDKSGSYIVFGIAPPAPPKPKEAADVPTFELWSTYDGLIPTMKKNQAAAEARRTLAAIYRIAEKKVVVLADEKLRDVSIGSEAKRFAIGSDPLPYLSEVAYDGGYRDVSVVSLETGARRKVLTHHGGAVSLSPDEKWLLWWDGKSRSWLSQDVEGKSAPRSLTSGLKVSFAEEDWDTPGAPNSYGFAGWTEGDREVVLYDRFDLWAVSPDTGATRRLTQGRERGVRFRYARLDPEERQLPEKKPWLLASIDDETRATGYGRLAPNGTLTRLHLYDGALGGLQKAKDADTVLFTRERFEVFPDLWSAPSVEAMGAATKLTDANPQQKEIRWGRSERILYRTADGKELPAILTVPEDLDPTKKYPLMVYIYEKLSQGLHRYVRPAPGTSINVSRYVSNGYVVLQPDIEYREGYPGESALACVVPAVQEVLRRGYIDEKRIGLQGHSWGAYQTTYLITRTNLFRAVEAGASVANMFSAYGGIRYESGMSRQFQYEKTQSRIGATPWQKPLAYLENSPIFWADKVNTPYLTIHNDADGAVPYTQGIEFFMALKRLGKEAFLFNYNGEGHGLTQRDNQKHWSLRMAEFFDHYLLSAPRPEWMGQR